MFRVSGYFNGVAYDAHIDPSARRPLRGVVNAPPSVLTLLLANKGHVVMMTPTGPSVTADLDDPAAALAALYALTDVVEVQGDDIPDVLPPSEPDRVY